MNLVKQSPLGATKLGSLDIWSLRNSFHELSNPLDFKLQLIRRHCSEIWKEEGAATE